MNPHSIATDDLESLHRPYLVYLIALVAAVGGFLFGFDLSIISGAMVFIRDEFQLSPSQEGSATSSALLGCMLGPLFGSFLADRVGRRKTLILSGLLFTAGAIGTALPSTMLSFTVERFNFFRIIGGLGVGLASVVSPMFIAEMAPARIRGALVTVNQLAIVIGLACAVIVSYFLSFDGQWRWMLLSNTFPVPILIGGLLLIPESPRWLMQQQRRAETLRCLAMINGQAEAEAELREIEGSLHLDGPWKDLVVSQMRFPLFLACMLALFQQVTGASILTMYMPALFKEAGYTSSTAAIQMNVLMSLWYIACTVIAMLAVDRLGRRPLLIGGTLGMTVGMGLLAMLFHGHATGLAIFFTMTLVMGAYLVSLAPLAWLIMSEIFPTRLRGKAMGIASVCTWTASYFTARYFPPLVDQFKAQFGTPAMLFAIYAALSFAALLFSWYCVPETKGRTLEELGDTWSSSSTPRTFH